MPLKMNDSGLEMKDSGLEMKDSGLEMKDSGLEMKDSEILLCVQVKVEIGHRASPRAKPTKEGFTHDWTVYVRAPQGSNLAHFVDKVEFHLHDTFADPLRVVTKPPYHVSEVGYADFDLPIEIYFKNKGEPQKIKFNYNLFLQTHKPVDYIRCEKLTFVNPTDEFKKNLIKAGGVYVLPPRKAQSADLCGPPMKTESLKKQKQPSTISSKVHVPPLGKAQFADLCAQPLKTESLKKEKQPSTISSKVLALPPVDAQFADFFGSPLKVTKQKQPSNISSKENVSKQLLNFSGDENPSSSGKNSTSLNSTTKQVKTNNKGQGHADASTSSDSSSSSISKENIQKTQSSMEKPSCKKSNNSSKIVPNPLPLPSHKRPSDHLIPSENNQPKIQVNTDKVEKYEHSLSKSTDAKKSAQRKRSGSLVSELDSSIAKKQKVSHLSKVIPMELKEDISFPIVNMEKSTCKIDRINKVKNQRKTVRKYVNLKTKSSRMQDEKHPSSSESDDDFYREISLSEADMGLDNSPNSNHIYSMSDLKMLMHELEDSSADDEDEEQINRSGFSVSALDRSVAKEQQKTKDFSQLTLMALKEDLYISSDSSSESDDDFYLEISLSESDMDLDISPNSNHIFSLSDLKMLMHELEDSSADDEDDRKSEITTTKSGKRKRSGSPQSTLFGSMAKKQRVSLKHLSNDSLMEVKEESSRSR